MQDRRNRERKRPKGHLVICDRQTDAVIGQVVDLSEQGVKLYSKQPVFPEYVQQCRMALPGEFLGKTELEFGLVGKWYKTDDDTGLHHAGYEFEGMTPENLEVIRLLMKSWSISPVMVGE